MRLISLLAEELSAFQEKFFLESVGLTFPLQWYQSFMSNLCEEIQWYQRMFFRWTQKRE